MLVLEFYNNMYNHYKDYQVFVDDLKVIHTLVSTSWQLNDVDFIKFCFCWVFFFYKMVESSACQGRGRWAKIGF